MVVEHEHEAPWQRHELVDERREHDLREAGGTREQAERPLSDAGLDRAEPATR
jgi:hypothetical protein